ncbi:MAG: ABC transporter ATP-binding protein, partial [Spirochaetia bacterium]|nr:ABC transporter ATP-binding protein [Spirochaetia bacterium]
QKVYHEIIKHSSLLSNLSKEEILKQILIIKLVNDIPEFLDVDMKELETYFSEDSLDDRLDIFLKSDDEVRDIRGKHISMIFQDPLTSLNPVIKIWMQIAEALMLHHKLGKKEAKQKAIELLTMIGIPDAPQRGEDYPHQFSGGMRQRVMIAMALSCSPDILIADEPTTALDVTIQAQILDLIKNLSKEHQTSVIMITHDLGVVAEMCDTICVMYAGRIVERASAEHLFYEPKHPYTIGLLNSIPRIDRDRNKRLHTIEGSPPDLVDLPKGCPFLPRCEFALEKCAHYAPPEFTINGDDNWKAACFLHEKGQDNGKQ